MQAPVGAHPTDRPGAGGGRPGPGGGSPGQGVWALGLEGRRRRRGDLPRSYGRHATLWAAGKDLDEQSGVSHLAHIRATCAILLDAIDAGAFIDNRKVSPETIRILKAYDASSMPVVVN
ncbi:dATP/dGTP diphosphohydrolase domain-containing protein [Methylobacterium sp.]|uniref:dATP/dGTP diphosphohydrolase domain-containing protein n=1 Tax=Methylobacterium sp. TaxID=409 RepID=UPI003B018424